MLLTNAVFIFRNEIEIISFSEFMFLFFEFLIQGGNDEFLKDILRKKSALRCVINGLQYIR